MRKAKEKVNRNTMNQPPLPSGTLPPLVLPIPQTTPQPLPAQLAQPPTQSRSVTINTITPSSLLPSIPSMTPSLTIVSNSSYVQSPVFALQKHEKLKDGNWNAWKMCIISILESKGILDIVIGETLRPPGPEADLTLPFGYDGIEMQEHRLSQTLLTRS